MTDDIGAEKNYGRDWTCAWVAGAQCRIYRNRNFFVSSWFFEDALKRADLIMYKIKNSSKKQSASRRFFIT